ncbi:Tyrosyl-DNA phosphodiesterase [Penicillium occitanis (nom. inval.)]|nr:Tyrosyl-DNA phosphodiesterase [Penicillium occitanis (nom. inval.)]PCG91027.1 hypothetical protein PENOC_099230 [Penicillium occitanis (nom. inval.)]
MAHDNHDDPALRAALEASMRGQTTPQTDFVDLTGDSDDESKSYTTPENVIDLEDEEIDDDLKLAIALSMQEMQQSPPSGVLNGHDSGVTDGTATDNDKPTHVSPNLQHQPATVRLPAVNFGIPGLDRKKLEEERLARVAKRKAESSISPPPLKRDSKLAKREVSPDHVSELRLTKGLPATSAQALASPKKSVTSRTSAPESKPKTAQPSSTPSPQFPKGVVKKTWAFGYSRDGDDIKIEEVLQTADVELAILSAFQWDMEWMFSKFRTPGKTRFMLVMQAKEESTRLQYQEQTADMSNIRLCFPPMEGQVNCMHSKLMLLFHPEYLRIVVPSANMVPYDWGEQGGVMENTVFLIDLPKKSTHDAADAPKTAFHEELAYFLKASTLHENIIAKLSSFDFSETSRYAFVHTVGGSHFGESLTRTGHCGLSRAVKSLGLKTESPVNVDFVTSSIGALTDEFMRSMYLSAQGGDAQQNTGSEWKSRFRVYYPSEQTVSQSKGSRRSAGTICFQEKWFTGPKFPRNALHDCISRREGLLMHNKMMFVRPKQPIALPDGSNCTGWAYVGSANLSESAWGKIVHDRVRKEPKLNCRNWECGVLVPITESSQSSSSDEAKKEDKSGAEGDIVQIFGSTVPVPMRVPAPSLGPGLKPWYGAW